MGHEREVLEEVFEAHWGDQSLQLLVVFELLNGGFPVSLAGEILVMLTTSKSVLVIDKNLINSL